MALLEIPVRSDIPAYTFSIELEGVVYVMIFTFNARYDRWFMDIKTNEEVDLLLGVPLIASIPLTDRFKDDRLPPGTFVVVDLTGENRDPTRFELGEDMKLVYQESA